MSISIVFSLYYKLDAGVIPLVGSVSMLVPLVVVPLVSLITKPFPERHLNRVFGTPGISGKSVVLDKKEAYSTGR